MIITNFKGRPAAEVAGKEKMRKEIAYEIMESDFGSSTSCICTFSADGLLIHIQDTSTFETNWVWDRWDSFPALGSTEEEVDNFFNHYFDDWDDEYRRPYVKKWA